MDHIEHAKHALALHGPAGFNTSDGPDVKLFHLLCSLLEYCDAQTPRIDFDAVLEDARQFLNEHG